jgi:orotidine-5'-phosphate decarboxylase
VVRSLATAIRRIRSAAAETLELTNVLLREAGPQPRAAVRDHIALALDVESIEDAAELARKVSESVGVLKIGLELFTRHGPAAVDRLQARDQKIFLDLKLHDIPETVERSVRGIASLGVDMLTVHAAGGTEMLKRARAAAPSSLTLLAVTVLTSLDSNDVRAIGFERTPKEQALHLARMALDAGISGLVTSPEEVGAMRQLSKDAVLVTPGVRPAGSASGDQKRTRTPKEAIASGADLIVVGRPIRDASDPAAAALDIAWEVAAGLEARAPSPS